MSARAKHSELTTALVPNAKAPVARPHLGFSPWNVTRLASKKAGLKTLIEGKRTEYRKELKTQALEDRFTSKTDAVVPNL